METRFDRDTRVTPEGDGRYAARIDSGWWIARGPNGGYVAAILLRALEAELDDPGRSPRSFTVHFTAAPREGRARIEVALERRGRSMASLSGRLIQQDRLCALALATFSPSWPGPRLDGPPPPAVPPPEGLARREETSPATLRARYDSRPVEWPCAEGELVTGGWMRTLEPRVANAALIAALSDSWPPALHTLGRIASRATPTVDLTVHFRQTLPIPGAEPDDFYLTRFETRMLEEGFSEEDGQIWTRDGRLIAQSRQLAVLLG